MRVLHRIQMHTTQDQRIGKSLDANSDGTMAQVRSACFLDGVIIQVYYAVQVLGDYLHDAKEFQMIKDAVIYKLGQRD